MLSQALQAWAAGHPSLRLLTHPDQMAPFLLDWRKRYQGAALAVAQPSSTAEVAAVVQWCLAHPAWRLSVQTHKVLGIR